jgi:hypothetical protein
MWYALALVVVMLMLIIIVMRRAPQTGLYPARSALIDGTKVNTAPRPAATGALGAQLYDMASEGAGDIMHLPYKQGLSSWDLSGQPLDDRISSIKVSQGCRVTAWRDTLGQGGATTHTGPQRSNLTAPMNNAISSVQMVCV